MAPKGALVAVLLYLGEVFAKVEIVGFGKLDQNLAPKGALVAVLLCLRKFFTNVKIFGFGFKLFVRFGFKLSI